MADSSGQPKSTSQNFSKKAQAAVLLAADELNDEAIALTVGVSRRTLSTWKNLPEFQAMLSDAVDEIQRRMLRHAIAKRHRRVAILNDLHEKLLKVIDERAEEYAALATSNDEDVTIPSGGGTGLIVRQIKQIGAGPSAQIIEEFNVDTPTIKTIQGLQEQAAKELGQWTERKELTGKDGAPFTIVFAEREDGPQ